MIANTMPPSRTIRSLGYAAAFALLSLARPAAAQISLVPAVDLALRNSPRVLMAEADVERARAALSETRDVYIPSVSVGGSGYGRSYGYPLGQPTIVNIVAQSLVFTFSQQDYVRSARAGLAATEFALAEARAAVAEDTVLTYIALDRDGAREAALSDEQSLVTRLVNIVADRLAAGEETAVTLTSTRLVGAQIRLKLLQAQDEHEIDRLHFAHLIGLPAEGLDIVENGIQAIPAPTASSIAAPPSPGIDAAFANARAKREQAFGDARYLFRPQVSFAAQYSRISTFNNANYLEYFGRRDATGNELPFPSNSFGAGVQVTVPILDYLHRARARESAAEAVRAERDANVQRDQFLEGRLRTERATVELAAHAEVAELDQQLAQQQLDITLVELQHGIAGAAPLTPKEEQNARIAEREKYLAVVDSRFQMRQAQVNLLRQTGGLERWLKTVAQQDSSKATLAVHP